MKSLNLLPALALLAIGTVACGEEKIEETYVEPAPIVETPAPAPAPVIETVAPAEERAAEPERPVNARMALMPDEMRYRNMNQGYTAEDFERMGVEIKDDMYGTDRY